jgi:hypothetical protein
MPPYTITRICNFFCQQSISVWKRIEFARTYNLRISETTITENFLFNFYTEASEAGLPVRLYEAKEENVNGNDLEVFIQTASGYLLIPCQAKILNKQNKYAKVFHKIGDDYQVKLLWDYARRLKGIPGYLFYNYIPYSQQRSEFQDIGNEEHYGISFCTAHKFKHALDYKKIFGGRLEVPTFNGIHPHDAYPFHQLVCEILQGLGTFPRTSGPDDSQDVYFYSDAEIRDEDNWRRMPELGQIGFITQDDLKQRTPVLAEKQVPGFKPKYRLVINGANNREEGGLYRIS